MTEPTAVIHVTRQKHFNGHGSRFPFSWFYDCHGPDGTRFTNKNIAELRAVLMRKYGRNTIISEDYDHKERLT